MSELILHHFRMSPFAQKVRTAFGIKGLAWRSVEIPAVMPKPELTALTGGYRNTPVLQVGADVYCDTQCILRELERRHPGPTILPADSAGAAWAVNAWADRVFYTAANMLVFGANADKLPAEFIRDREAHRGHQIDLAQLGRDIPRNRAAVRAQLVWLEAGLAGGRPWLLEGGVSLADIAAYGVVWNLMKALDWSDELFSPFPAVREWAGRMADFGNGEAEDLGAAEALELSRGAVPEDCAGDEDEDWQVGQAVTVTPDDKGRVPSAGELACIDRWQVAIRRRDPRAGEIVVHFPRAGFIIAAA